MAENLGEQAIGRRIAGENEVTKKKVIKKICGKMINFAALLRMGAKILAQ